MQEETEIEQPEEVEADAPVETAELDNELQDSLDRWQEQLEAEDLERDKQFDEAVAETDDEPEAELEQAVETSDQPTKVEAEATPQTQDDEPSEGIRALREANKDKAKRLKELEARLAELEESTKQPPEPPDELARLEQKYSTEDMLTFLARYEAGEAEGDESQLRELRSLAIQALERKDSGEIYDVMRAAQANRFGGLSRDVEDAATQALTRAIAAEKRNAGKVQAQRDWQSQRNASLGSLKEVEGLIDNEGNFNDESELGKSYITAGQELAQIIPNFKDLADAPSHVLRYTQLLQKESQYEKLAQENAELRKRLGRANAPIPVGQSPSPAHKKSRSAEDELLAAFTAAGVTGV
jgi:hypothetical protein